MKLFIVCVLVVISLVFTRGEQPEEGCYKEDGTFVKEGEEFMDGCARCVCNADYFDCVLDDCDLDLECSGGAKPERLEGKCCPSCPQ